MKEQELKQKYITILLQAKMEMNTISQMHPEYLQKEEIKNCIDQLINLISIPYQPDLVQKIVYQLENLKELEVQANLEPNGGIGNSYVKVKKGIGMPIYETENPEPLYDQNRLPVVNHVKTAQDFPAYQFNSRGSSSPIMLAFLTCFFQTIFLILSFLFYNH